MLATTWDKIRDEKSRIYGPHSYVYRSTDAGRTWTKVHNAPLPQSETEPGAADAGQPRRPDGRRLQRQRPQPRVPDLEHRPRQLQRLLHQRRRRRHVDRGRADDERHAADHQRRLRLVVRPGLRRPGRTRCTSSSRASASPRASTAAPTWTTSQTPHADQHGVEWDPFTPNKVYLGNDGGFYWSHAERRRARPVDQDPAPARRRSSTRWTSPSRTARASTPARRTTAR